MPAMNTALIGQGLDTITAFYAAGIDCPPLVEFAEWLRKNMLNTETETSAAAASNSSRAPNAGYDAKVLAAIQAAPAGFDREGLKSQLAALGLPTRRLGFTLTRLTRAKKIEERSGRWYATIATASGGKIDRSLVNGTRRPRSRKATPPAAETGTGTADASTTEQQPIAAAG